jgi:hypothetical protein
VVWQKGAGQAGPIKSVKQMNLDAASFWCRTGLFEKLAKIIDLKRLQNLDQRWALARVK